eukprot:TRINITY_DN9410_c0_g1_i1.p1 TRINITY_DN9410_c0_g1~~TRINITY_DN9410_c0_g1_i1.p1  ORF type:complete len:305 (+),score=58.93 TRINITY_DN9410_c0_g1_i1:200-1114(+)
MAFLVTQITSPLWNSLMDGIDHASLAVTNSSFVAPIAEPSFHYVQYFWDSLFLNFGAMWTITAFYWFDIFIYALFGTLLWALEKRQWNPEGRIQPGKWPSQEDYSKCLKNLGFNFVFVVFPIQFLAHPICDYLGIHGDGPLPTCGRFAFDMFCFLVIEDFVHYWFHRALHHKLVYKHIHKVHHDYSAPFGLSAAYAHPVEVLVLGLATFAGPFILRPHLFTFLCWIVVRQLDAVKTHCGWRITDPMDLVPFHGGAVFHDAHHEIFVLNFGSRFTYLDHLFGTYTDLTERHEKARMKLRATKKSD